VHQVGLLALLVVLVHRAGVAGEGGDVLVDAGALVLVGDHEIGEDLVVDVDRAAVGRALPRRVISIAPIRPA
jgi:hypothetical protein